jgi:hypothetical protein
MKNYLFLFGILLFAACNRAKTTVRAAVNTTGELVGQTAAEFADGVSEGVTQTFDCTITTAKNLESKGVSGGKFSIASDSTGSNNKLTVYLIFDADFTGDIMAKIKDKSGKEYGRIRSSALNMKKGDAKNIDFVFDVKTNIESQSKIILE